MAKSVPFVSCTLCKIWLQWHIKIHLLRLQPQNCFQIVFTVTPKFYKNGQNRFCQTFAFWDFIGCIALCTNRALACITAQSLYKIVQKLPKARSSRQNSLSKPAALPNDYRQTKTGNYGPPMVMDHILKKFCRRQSRFGVVITLQQPCICWWFSYPSISSRLPVLIRRQKVQPYIIKYIPDAVRENGLCKLNWNQVNLANANWLGRQGELQRLIDIAVSDTEKLSASKVNNIGCSLRRFSVVSVLLLLSSLITIHTYTHYKTISNGHLSQSSSFTSLT